MISVEEAKQLMMAQIPERAGLVIELADAYGRYALEDVISRKQHPLFDMSAVDGFAFRYEPVSQDWLIVGEVQAGQTFARSVHGGECVRIFTGAMIPTGADTVVMQEFVERRDDHITHRDAKLITGGNVRKKGEQVRVGDVLMKRGTLITAEGIGLLASVGVGDIICSSQLQVHVLVTGNEFLNDPEDSVGKIHTSNGAMLSAALHAVGVSVSLENVPDDRATLIRAFREASKSSDLVISTGGVSVGDHDLVREAIEGNDGAIHVHGVAQKPGKPMLFATIGGKPCFGLPGNPRAVMVLFWEYVLPFLRAAQGAMDPWLLSDRLPLDEAVNAKGDRAEFRAAMVKEGRVTLLKDEGSHMLRSLMEANALAYLPSSERNWDKGSAVEVHYLPR